MWYTAEPLVEVLERAFPALEHIAFEGNMAYDALLESAPSDPYLCMAWKRLQTLKGHVAGIYTLSWSGIRVYFLDVTECLVDLVNTPVGMKAVASLQPTMLRLSVAAPNSYLTRTMFEPLAECLKVLEVEVRGTPERVRSYKVRCFPQFLSQTSV
jgi:hypothetical protein